MKSNCGYSCDGFCLLTKTIVLYTLSSKLMIRFSAVTKVALFSGALFPGAIAAASLLVQPEAHAASLTFAVEFDGGTSNQVRRNILGEIESTTAYSAGGTGTFTIDVDTPFTVRPTVAPAPGAGSQTLTNTITDYNFSLTSTALTRFFIPGPPPQGLLTNTDTFTYGRVDTRAYYINEQGALAALFSGPNRGLTCRGDRLCPDNRWTSGDGIPNFFQMSGQQISPDLFEGSFFAQLDGLLDNNVSNNGVFFQPNQIISGSWRATAIPEPTTLTGLALAAGFGAWMKRKSLAKSA
jgi:hypothetical protein